MPDERELTLEDYIAILRRRWFIIVISFCNWLRCPVLASHTSDRSGTPPKH